MSLPLVKDFISEDCFALLFIEKPEIPDRIREAAKKQNLVEKSEFHISTLVTSNARKVRAVISQNDLSENLKEKVASLFTSFSWEYSLMNEYFLQENFYTKEELKESGHPELPEHTRRTIVQKVNIPDMSLFYEGLSDMLKTSFDLPIAHITLFSWSDYNPLMMRGIGVSSEEDFRKYSKGKL